MVENEHFDVACFCHCEQEYLDFVDPKDARPKTWLVMNRYDAEIQSGFTIEGKNE